MRYFLEELFTVVAVIMIMAGLFAVYSRADLLNQMIINMK